MLVPVVLFTSNFLVGVVVPIPTFCDVSIVIAVVPADWIVSAVAAGLLSVGTVSAVPLKVRLADPANAPELLY
jgi:hypothetical protein